MGKESKIKIFIAGSKLIGTQRNIMRSVLSRMQNLWDIRIDSRSFEDFNTAVSNNPDGQQGDYNRFIAQSADIVAFVFDKSVGEISLHEFDVAYNAYRTSGRPAIYVYCNRNHITLDADLEKVRKRLDDLNLYYIEYEDDEDLGKRFYDDINAYLVSRGEPSRHWYKSWKYWLAIVLALCCVVGGLVGCDYYKSMKAFEAATDYEAVCSLVDHPGFLKFFSDKAAALKQQYDSLRLVESPNGDYPNWDKAVTLGQLQAVTSLFSDMRPVSGHDFMAQRYEVNKRLWGEIMGVGFSADSAYFPVTDVSFDQCEEFCRRLSDMSGLTFALPTEAQWETLARGGDKTENTIFAGADNPDEVAWYEGTSSGRVHAENDPTDRHTCNEIELYNVSGNVAEWCDSPFDADAPEVMVIRGGSFDSSADEIKVEARDCLHRADGLPTVGLRLIMPMTMVPQHKI